MNQRTAKELRRVFGYSKSKNHEGFDIKYSGQRIKEIYTLDGDMVKVRQEPVNMVTYYCKDRERRFYKMIKKVFKQAGTKSPQEISSILKDLYTSEGI